MALFFCPKYTYVTMDYGCADKGAFDSGTSFYAKKNTSTSHIKPNESGGAGGSKTTKRPYSNPNGYTSQMGWGKNKAQQ